MPPKLSEDQSARVAERSRPRRSDFREVTLPDLPKVPGMISNSDRRYLYWLASQCYTGTGAVVEVGTWLGLSTIHLGAGLRDAGWDDVLHCYDRFRWSAGHAAKARLPLRSGDDFQPYFERNVRPIYPGVKVTRGDLADLVWTGGPIEILFLDAPKHLPAISDTLAVFGPALVPGLSLIALQDYTHFPSYSLAAVLSTLGDHLELVHVVERGGTASFAVRKRLDFGHAQPLAWDFRRWSKQQAIETWDRVLEPLGEYGRRRLEPGLAMLLYDLGEVEAACDCVRRLSFDEQMTERWRGFAESLLYFKYKPLFAARRIRPTLRGRIDLVRKAAERFLTPRPHPRR